MAQINAATPAAPTNIGDFDGTGDASAVNTDETRVLIVDDDEFVRKTLKAYLASSHFIVATANDGNEALDHVRDNPVDAVVTDVIMPNREGIETIHEIRRLNPDCAIVAISGGGRTGSGDFLEMAQRMGADVTLKKPFRKDELIKAIAEAMIR